MGSEEKNQYTVELTPTSQVYFYEALEYIYQHNLPKRAEQISRELKHATQSLDNNPNRGVKEKRLKNRPQNYQFILYKRTKRTDIKIIYYVDEENKMVYVTDFFPTEKDDSKITWRS